MQDTQDKLEEQKLRGQLEREELKEATRHFFRSLVRTGKSAPLTPITRIPLKPRQHFLAAGVEFTRGWAALIREVADGIDRLAEGGSVPAHATDGNGVLARPSEDTRDTRNSARGNMVVRAQDKE
jgi:hypothetical protein